MTDHVPAIMAKPIFQSIYKIAHVPAIMAKPIFQSVYKIIHVPAVMAEEILFGAQQLSLMSLIFGFGH